MTERWKAPWEEMAEAGRLADATVEFIRRRHQATFVEVTNAIGQYMETEGDVSLETNQMNLIYWAGMSDEFCALIQDLLKEKRIFLHSVHALAYLFDGRALGLPLAKKLPKGGYKTPHWAPVTLSVHPL